MKKIKNSANWYTTSSVIFWIFFLLLAIFNKVIIKLFNLTYKIIGIELKSFIGLILLIIIIIWFFSMFVSSYLLLSSSKYALIRNYKSEARWSKSVFALNLLFTAIFIIYFVIKVLLVTPKNLNEPISEQNPPILIDEVLWIISAKYYSLHISNLINYLGILGILFVFISFTLSITLSQRMRIILNKVKKYKEYEFYNLPINY